MISLLKEEIKEIWLEGNKEENKFLCLIKEEVAEINDQIKETWVNFLMDLKDVHAYNEEIEILIYHLR